MYDFIKENIIKDDKDYKNNYVVISPDEGAIKRCETYASLLKLQRLFLSKSRDYSKKVEEVILVGDKKYIENRTCII